jgi:hypothetical protein
MWVPYWVPGGPPLPGLPVAAMPMTPSDGVKPRLAFIWY